MSSKLNFKITKSTNALITNTTIILTRFFKISGMEQDKYPSQVLPNRYQTVESPPNYEYNKKLIVTWTSAQMNLKNCRIYQRYYTHVKY